MWNLIARVAPDPTDWRAQLELLDMRTRPDDPVALTVPRFHRFGEDDQGRERVDMRLRSLDDLLSNGAARALHPPPGLSSAVPVWIDVHEPALTAVFVGELCEGYAALWGRLDAFLGGDAQTTDTHLDGLTAALKELHRRTSPDSSEATARTPLVGPTTTSSHPSQTTRLSRWVKQLM